MSKRVFTFYILSKVPLSVLFEVRLRSLRPRANVDLDPPVEGLWAWARKALGLRPSRVRVRVLGPTGRESAGCWEELQGVV